MSDKLFYYNPQAIPQTGDILTADIGIYGGNAAGIVAALQAKKMGLTSVICEPLNHIGGLTTGGLSYTDFGSKRVIGGLSRTFYQRCGAHYGVDEEWKFEPKIASQVLAEMLNESGAAMRTQQFIQSVQRDVDNSIREVVFEGGLRVRARVWLDCSYEGDLLARAGVSFHVGRESNETFGETLNGAQVMPKHQFDFAVDPWNIARDENSGLLPQIEAETPRIGAGDRRVQAYNFRLCLSKNPDNQRMWELPAGYDARQYELLARYLAGGWKEAFRKFDPIRGDKCDMNNHGAVSSDFIGRNWEYPTGDYATRERIFQEHVTYQKGLMWFRAHDERSPQWLQEGSAEWGLPLDEFTATDGWPPQLYIREARRMMGEYVMSEADCKRRNVVEDVVGMASYTIDSHNCTRFLQRNGEQWSVKNDGDVQVPVEPYPVSLRSIAPLRAECPNLVVPVCLSSSHIAYGSIRMEPVFMVLAQSAATLAALSLQGERAAAVQNVPYETLHAQLEADKQVLRI